MVAFGVSDPHSWSCGGGGGGVAFHGPSVEMKVIEVVLAALYL